MQKGHLKWVEISNAANKIIKYRLAAPSVAGTYIFSGVFVLKEDELQIIGNNQIIVK